MLESIKIKNFALLEKASIEFSPGLNVITGRTGAGKSILINSLSMVLGERVDRKIVRSGSDFCEVVALFDGELPSAAVDFLKEKDLYEEELILRRKFYARGRSKCYINDRNVPLSTLKHLGDMLVDIHSQHQHQSLLQPSVQARLLDRYSSSEKEADEIRGIWKEKNRLKEKISSLGRKQKETDREISRLRSEKSEIDSLNPEPGLDEQIEKEYRIVSNMENLYAGAEEIYSSLYDKENSISEIIASYLGSCSELAEVDERLKPVCEYLRSALLAIEEASMTLGSYVDSTQFEPERLEKIMEKRSKILGLKRKFGPEMEDVLSYRKQLNQRLQSHGSYQQQIKKLKDELKEAESRMEKVALKLSSKRKKGAEKLKKEIEENLKTLGMESAGFNVRLQALDEIGPAGREEARFYISPNPGEPEMDFARIASGGEISRVMLAVKSALTRSDRTPLLIFDEIDAGIGASLGNNVGEKLKELSSFHQIITVTHLAQIASRADHHIKVNKTGKGGRTVTEIKEVKGNERVREVARMLGGKEEGVSGIRAKQILKS